MIDQKGEVTDIGIYIHIPFCPHKCGYCSFNSYDRFPHLIPAYVDALKREIRDGSGLIKGRGVSSIFFGGGTPTSIPVDNLTELLELCLERFLIREGAEITIEANPVTVSRSLMSSLRSAGFNRLSLGIQSFNREYLHTLERSHSPEEAVSSFEVARSAGFDNISSDMMFGIPGENLTGWERDLERLISLAPEHISAYNLTVEEGSRFYTYLTRGNIILPGDEAEREMFEAAIDMLTASGYNQYEISNFAKRGSESRHNKIYWRNEEYLGFGAGAFSYLAGERRQNADHIDAYIEGINSGEGLIVSSERLTPEGTARETMMMNLRLMEGVDREGFSRRFGIDPYTLYNDEIDDMLSEGLIELDSNRIRLTRRGLIFSNNVFMEFV
ncbi:MAG: radical SAM family heme chaperone HemW [Nitrospinae bacterium]|nr:radical SAM family heme chaperone HemW [Nitrospinota bacterium]